MRLNLSLPDEHHELGGGITASARFRMRWLAIMVSSANDPGCQQHSRLRVVTTFHLPVSSRFFNLVLLFCHQRFALQANLPDADGTRHSGE